MRMPRAHRAAGALIGSAVGDALGAPFEFGPPGQFTARFPAEARGVATEMCGAPGREPGEFTDDTQLALLLAQQAKGEALVVQTALQAPHQLDDRRITRRGAGPDLAHGHLPARSSRPRRGYRWRDRR